MERLRLSISDQEFEALVRLSKRELRPIPDQARAILRDRLQEAGLLKPAPPAAEWRERAEWAADVDADED